MIPALWKREARVAGKTKLPAKNDLNNPR
jgi:hypothetical protein